MAVELESSAVENEEAAAAKLPQVQRLLRDFPDHRPSALLACIKVCLLPFRIVLILFTLLSLHALAMVDRSIL